MGQTQAPQNRTVVPGLDDETNQLHWGVKTLPVSLSCVVNLHHDVLTPVDCTCLAKVQYKEGNTQINRPEGLMCVNTRAGLSGHLVAV